MKSFSNRFAAMGLVLALSYPTQAPWAAEKAVVAVPPLAGAENDRARQALMNALKATGAVSLVDPSAVDTYLKDRQAPIPEKSAQEGGGQAQLKQGISQYRELEIDKAISSLSKAKNSFRNNLQDGASFEGLRAAEIYLAMTYLAKRLRTQAKEELKAAILLDPERKTRKLPEKYYPPDIRKLFEEARREVLSGEKGSLQILSKEGGELVKVDGKALGVAPLRVEELPVGEHFVRVEGENREPFFSTQAIASGENRMTVELRPLTRMDPTLFFATVRDASQVGHERAAFLDEMGLSLGAQVFVFLSPEQGAVRAQLYDQRSQEVSLLERDKDPEGLARKLVSHLGPDGYVKSEKTILPSTEVSDSKTGAVPEKYQPPAESRLSEQANRPLVDSRLPGDKPLWYKNKWVWIGVGAVLVIAGAAAIGLSGVAKSDATSSTLTVTVPAR